ncbi:hypothetical protein ABK040_005063 [Willaertia magna]
MDKNEEINLSSTTTTDETTTTATTTTSKTTISINEKLQIRREKVKQRDAMLSTIRCKACKLKTTTSFHFDNQFNEMNNNNSYKQLSTTTNNSASTTILKPSQQYSTVFTPYYERRKRLPKSQQLQDLPKLVEDLYLEYNDYNTILEATTRFRRLLSIERNPPIDEVIQSGAVPFFVQYLDLKELEKYFIIEGSSSFNVEMNSNSLDSSSNGSDSRRGKKPTVTLTQIYILQFEACWALTNIASGTSDHTRYVVSLDAIPKIIPLMKSESEDLRQQSVWAIGNIAGDSSTLRDLVLSFNVVPVLIEILKKETSLRVKRDTTWTLSNCFRGKPIPEWHLVKEAIPLLSTLIYESDEDILTDACWALSYLSDGPSERIQAVVEAGVVRRLIELLCHHQSAIQTPALRTVGNIATGDDLQTQTLLNVNLLSVLPVLFNHPKKTIRKEVMWCISNIVAGNQAQIQAVIDANIFPSVINILSTDVFDVKKEAAWVVANTLEGGNLTQTKYLVQCGAINPLCKIMDCKDAKIVNVALDGIDSLLRSYEKGGDEELQTVVSLIEEAQGLDYLEKLQYHNNREVAEKATTILENYFELEDENGEEGEVGEETNA